MRNPIIVLSAAVLTAVLLAGCSSSGSSGGGSGASTSGGGTTDAVSASVSTGTPPIVAWAHTVQPDFQSVADDTSTIATDAGNQDVTGLTTACGALKDDVVRFEADPAAPDAELRADIARAMDAYSTAATQCLAGDYTASGDSLDSGNRYADAATARITALSSGP